MLYNCREYTIPATSQYQIRHYIGNKAAYTTVGSDYDAALSMLAKFTASRQLEASHAALGIITPVPEVAPPTLVDQLAEFLAKKNSPSLDLSAVSIHLYTTTLTAFVKHCKRTYAREVTETDVISFIDWLGSEGYAEKVWVVSSDGKRIRIDGARKGYSQKSLVMRYVAIRGFLRTCGVQVEKIIEGASHKRLSVKPEQNTDPYTQKDLDKFFAACDDDYRMIFTFLLSTGLRFREASHLTWSHVDWERGIINVPGKQQVNRRYKRGDKVVDKAVKFKTKSRKGREVPIFASLRPLLEQWRQQHPGTVYVFGTCSDLPNGHWLEYGKQFWKGAGLNCKTCDGCQEHDECEGFNLHKFRHTFAHRCLDAGSPIHKVSKWMGHHSIEVTAIYLSGGSAATDRDPFAERRAA
jgi:integrase